MKKPHNIRNTNVEFDETLSFGQRMADGVAAFGGSWAFILLISGILVVRKALTACCLALIVTCSIHSRLSCSTWRSPP